MQSVADDAWSSINMFESKKVESTSSPYINDLKYGRPHQPSNQLKSKHQVNNKKEIKIIYKWLKKENKSENYQEVSKHQTNVPKKLRKSQILWVLRSQNLGSKMFKND